MLFVHTIGWDVPFPHYLYIIYKFCFQTWRVFQFWTQYNHITDGKSILSGPVLIEHIAGEQKHPEMSHFCGRHHNVYQPIDNSSAVHKVKTGPILQILKSYCIALMWDRSEWGVGVWRHMSDVLKICHTGLMWAPSALHWHSILQRCVSYLTIDCQALLGNSAWSTVAGAAKPIEQKNQMYK